VFDLGRDAAGNPYMVMELLDGMALVDLLAVEGTLDPARAIDLGAQMLSALAAAHGAGIVHRDLKPENVFLCLHDGRTPHVKLLDFGISKVLANPAIAKVTRETRHGMVMGTPEYMSPEQARGQTKLIDHRTDLWSAGVVLYEMLAGRPPFEGENYNALLARILEKTYPPLSELRPDIPLSLEAVITRALAFELNDRWQSAEDMRAALLACTVVEPPVDLDLDVDAGRKQTIRLAPPSPPPPPSPLPSVFAPPEPPAPVLALAPQPARPSRERLRIIDAPPARPSLLSPRARTYVILAAILFAVANATVAIKKLSRRTPPTAVTMRVLPEYAEVRIDGVLADPRDVKLALDSEHTISATARGYLSSSRRFKATADGVVELALPHALSLLDEADPPPLTGELTAATASPLPDWQTIDRGVQHVELHRACLAKASANDCRMLRNLARATGHPLGPVDTAAEAYLFALVAVEDGRPADPARAAAALRAELAAERARLDASELALLASAGDRDATWQVRRLLLFSRLYLRGGGEEHRVAAIESLAAAKGADGPLLAAAGELVTSLRRRKKAIPLYNQTVELFNAR
jgi:hypothetical protein